MLKATLNADGVTMVLEPSAKVSKANITKANKILRPWLEEGSDALLIVNESFEDWENFSSLIPSLIDDQKKQQIQSIAVVTDKPTANFGTTLKSLYSGANINIYCYCELEAAIAWISPDKANSAA